MPSQPSARQWSRFVPWLLGLIAAGMAARNLVGPGCDLGIYIDAGRELNAGGINIARAREGVGAIGYPPVAMLPFAWLVRMFGDTTIRWLWSIGLGLATTLIARDLPRALLTFGKLSWIQWVVCGALFQRCIAQNLTHGQLSLWVSALMLHGALRVQEGREWRGGALLGAAAALKLTPLVFVVVLPLLGRLRSAAMVALTFFALVCVLPIPFLGWHEHVRNLGDFYEAVIAPLFGGGKSVILAEHAASYSISGTLGPLLQHQVIDNDGRTVEIVDLSDQALAVVKMLWSAVVAALLAAWLWCSRSLPPERRLAHGASAAMMAIVFFSPLTRAYHLAGAMLPFAMFCRGPRNVRDLLWWGIAAAVAMSLTLRQKKLLGDTLWRTIDYIGVLHLAMVAMTVWLLLLARRDATRPVSS